MRHSMPVLSRPDRQFLARAGAVGGAAATTVFAVYNGALGLLRRSLWRGSICAYYVLLSLLRWMVLGARRKAGDEGFPARRALLVTSGLMLVMNVALIVPISLLVLDRRPVEMGLTPAIASAAYTTYKITASSLRLGREKGTVFDRELRVIGIADALVSVLVLQNTLIVAVDGGISPKMGQIVRISSMGIFLLILLLSLGWMVGSMRKERA